MIDTGSQTIVYRQTLPGVYEGVKVDLGPRMSGPDDVPFFPVLRGLVPGELVVTSGSFLVDAETRLNPAAGSIYFGGSSGSKSGTPAARPSAPPPPKTPTPKSTRRWRGCPTEDRKIAEKQQFCPVLPDNRLGSMGVPVKLMIENQPVFVCCDGLQRNGPGKAAGDAGEGEEVEGIATRCRIVAASAPAARRAIGRRRSGGSANSGPGSDAGWSNGSACPPKSRLGSMGTPVKVEIEGKRCSVLRRVPEDALPTRKER